MPNVTLHLLLAQRTLDFWAAVPERAGFPIDIPRFRDAFRQGSFGPDLGYFPGGHRLFSVLAHRGRSGDLTRALLTEAETPLERAFAWGWVTHVLADRLIHPAVGFGVGELTTGDRNRFISGEDDTAGHVRVETGLDAWISARHPDLSRCRFEPLFDERSIDFIARAYRRTYAIDVDTSLLFASYRNTIRMAGPTLASIGYMGRKGRSGVRWCIRSLSRCLAGNLPRFGMPGSLTFSYLSPLRPAPWLRREVMAVVKGFPREVEAVAMDPVRALPNVNLDTGLPEGAEPVALTESRSEPGVIPLRRAS